MTARKRNHRPSREKEALDRYFEGLPVEEADAPFLIVVDKTKVDGAVRGDPANCALSQACKVLYNSTAVLFFRTVAYIDVPNEAGDRVVKRFVITPAVRAAIERFDKTGEFPPGGFRLLPPAESLTLEGQRKSERRRRAAVLKGEREVVPNTNGQAGRGDALSLEGVRSGSGMVHFSPKAA